MENKIWLCYFVSEPKREPVSTPEYQEVKTPLGARMIRVVIYRGGGDALEWATREARHDETLLNVVAE